MMEYRKIRLLSACLPCLLAGIHGTAYAGADSGFYIGGSAGDASVESGQFDESDSAFKLIGGFNFGIIPLVDVAVEASYVDFGKPSRNNSSIEVTGLDAFGLAGLSFGPFGVFAKAGMISWDADTTAGTTSGSDSGTDPAYGLGARFALGPVSVRAEYELFDLKDDVDIELLSVGATYTF